jgi:hypothetical protein
MKQTIYYFRRQNYGNTQFYFALKRHREAFRTLTGKKTFTLPGIDLAPFNEFGYFKFEEVLESAAEPIGFNS